VVVVGVEPDVAAGLDQPGDARRIDVPEVGRLRRARDGAAEGRAAEAAEVVRVPGARLRSARLDVLEEGEVVGARVERELELRDREVCGIRHGNPEAALLLLAGLEGRPDEGGQADARGRRAGG